MSPLPSSFSAPTISKMVRESMPEETAKARREGILALITPVITSTEGRCVAIIKCMPAARAICARRQMESSTSPGAAIIKSANSSMMITICGIFASGSPFSSFMALKPLMSRTPHAAKSLYLSSISLTAQFSAADAFFGSVTTGMSK